MVKEVFGTLPDVYRPGSVETEISYYFSIGEVKMTVFLDRDRCCIENGKAVAEADCVCKTDPTFFLRIWNDGYRPGMKDFLSGTIRSNNPGALQDFLRAFGKGS